MASLDDIQISVAHNIEDIDEAMKKLQALKDACVPVEAKEMDEGWHEAGTAPYSDRDICIVVTENGDEVKVRYYSRGRAQWEAQEAKSAVGNVVKWKYADDDPNREISRNNSLLEQYPTNSPVWYEFPKYGPRFAFDDVKLSVKESDDTAVYAWQRHTTGWAAVDKKISGTIDSFCLTGKTKVTELALSVSKEEMTLTTTIPLPSLTITGSRDTLTTEGDKVKIGCEARTLEHWLSHYNKIGSENGYTGKQVDEYGAYLKAIKSIVDAREG